jgi:hypothetical protein
VAGSTGVLSTGVEGGGVRIVDDNEALSCAMDSK